MLLLSLHSSRRSGLHLPPLDLSVGLVPLGGDGVDLVNEDDRGGVLLGLLEGLPKVGLGLSGHLGHDLGPIDEEEEGSGLVGDGTSDQSLTRSGGTVKEHSAGGLDSKGLEEGGVAEGKL